MLFEYATYKLIWWCFMGVLIVGFALTDGHDFGIAIALPFAGRSDVERRIILNTISPTFEGSQTWLITAAGSLFAVWPLVYAAALSGFYVLLMLCLFALMLRPVGFHYRSKIAEPRWRCLWDRGLFVGGFLPPLSFGIAFGNLLQGLPFRLDGSMRLEYLGDFGSMLNPFTLLSGALGVAASTLYGSAYLQHKAGGAVAERARQLAMAAALLTILLLVGSGMWIAYAIDGYRISAMPDVRSAFLPGAKTVVRASGAWLDNYRRWPILLLFPATAVIGALLAAVFSARRVALAAVLSSGLALAALIGAAGATMFPFIMPSSLAPGSSLTAWDAAASHRTLALMFWVVVVLLPVVVAYTAWVYRVMRGKVTVDTIRANEHSAY